MLYINKITNDASQELILTGIPGISINLSLQFLPRVQQWIMGVTYNEQSIQGLSIVAGLNILRQWKNIIPFGISCVCPDGLDPYQIGDFANDRALLFLLNSDDVAQVEADWFTGTA
jgi:hypothetical protein